MNLFVLTFLSLLSVLFHPEKPKVLIIGDSISIGYFPFVKSALKDKADVYHKLFITFLFLLKNLMPDKTDVHLFKSN